MSFGTLSISASLWAALSSLRSLDNALCVIAALCIETIRILQYVDIKYNYIYTSKICIHVYIYSVNKYTQPAATAHMPLIPQKKWMGNSTSMVQYIHVVMFGRYTLSKTKRFVLLFVLD